MARQKRIQREPKSKLGLDNKLRICYNCLFYQKDGFCPWEMDKMNYNDKCNKQLRRWPHTFFRYRLDLPHRLLDPTKK